MKYSFARIAAAIFIALFGSGAGALLIAYSELDDAPGGVLIGLLVIVGAIAVAVQVARQHFGGRTARSALEERCRMLERELAAQQSHNDELHGQLLELQQQLLFADALVSGRKNEAQSIRSGS